MNKHDDYRWSFESLLNQIIHVKIIEVEDYFSGVVTVTMEFYDGKMAGRTVKIEVDTDQ